MNAFGGGLKAGTMFMAAVLVALTAGCGSRDEIFGTTGAGAGGGFGGGPCAAGNLPLAAGQLRRAWAEPRSPSPIPRRSSVLLVSPSITPAAGPSTLVGTIYDSSPASELT